MISIPFCSYGYGYCTAPDTDCPLEVIMDKKQALEAIERIFNYCEEIDLHIPEDERTGYNMLPDVQLVKQYIWSKDD